MRRIAVGLMLLIAAGALVAEDAATKKKKRAANDTGVDEAWVYDDLTEAIARAKAESKPIFLVFR